MPGLQLLFPMPWGSTLHTVNYIATVAEEEAIFTLPHDYAAATLEFQPRTCACIAFSLVLVSDLLRITLHAWPVYKRLTEVFQK
jgi:hypothetical protein